MKPHKTRLLSQNEIKEAKARAKHTQRLKDVGQKMDGENTTECKCPIHRGGKGERMKKEQLEELKEQLEERMKKLIGKTIWITPIRFFIALFGMYLLGMIAGYLA